MSELLKNFLSFADDEGKQTAINTLQDIQTTLEILCELGDCEQRSKSLSLLEDVNKTIERVLKSSWRMLGPDEKFILGDQAQEKNSYSPDFWFDVVDSVGYTLNEIPHWLSARRRVFEE